MQVDAAQYASIAREMMENGSMLEVYHRGKDYLDKPPLLFWLASTSMELFGVNNLAFKLPAVLVLMLGVYATFRFALLWYTRQKALLAALIVSTTQAFFLMSNDVRTDGLLTGFVIFSVWQLYEFLQKAKKTNLVLGALGAGAAMLSKGPIALIIIGAAIGGDLLLKRNWRAILNPSWLFFLAFVALLLLPMCYGLYTQFDLHPEKEVYGLSGPSGLKFFFWTQSFGRITGDIHWANDSGYFFFLQTILWDLQPWVLFFIPALVARFRKLFHINCKPIDKEEFASLSGFVFPFLALSLSAYKLPHYIFPLFPFASVMTAHFMVDWLNKKTKWPTFFSRIHFGLLHVFWIAPLFAFFLIFEPGSFILPFLFLLLFVVFWWVLISMKKGIQKVAVATTITAFSFGMIMSCYFYPNLLKYQAGSVVGKIVHERNIALNKFYFFHIAGHDLDFYSQRIVPTATTDSLAHYSPGTLVYTNNWGRDLIMNEMKLNYREDSVFNDFSVANLKLPFLLKDSREEHVRMRFLLMKNSDRLK